MDDKGKKNRKNKQSLPESVDIENSNLAIRMGQQTATTHFDLDTYEMDDEEENQIDNYQMMAVPPPQQSIQEVDQDDDDEDGEEDDDEDDSDEMNQEEMFWDTLDDTDDEDEDDNPGGSSIGKEDQQPKPPKIDVLSLWRMRVPRHRKLLKDCIIHLGKCTRRLDATADKREVTFSSKQLIKMYLQHI